MPEEAQRKSQDPFHPMVEEPFYTLPIEFRGTAGTGHLSQGGKL
jgi:hypothetical protein